MDPPGQQPLLCSSLLLPACSCGHLCFYLMYKRSQRHALDLNDCLMEIIRKRCEKGTDVLKNPEEKLWQANPWESISLLPSPPYPPLIIQQENLTSKLKRSCHILFLSFFPLEPSQSYVVSLEVIHRQYSKSHVAC